LNLLLQTLVNGLILGGVFSLAAVGFSLIFGVMNVVNLTHGAIVLIGAYLAYIFWHWLGLDPFLAIAPIMLLLAGFGYVYQRLLIQPATERSSLVASMLLTFGMALILRNLMVLIFSPDIKSISPPYAFKFVRYEGIVIDYVRLISLAVSLGLITVLALLLRTSEIGRVIRSTAQQELAARLCGVNVPHIFGITFAISAAFAGAAGVIIGIIIPFSPPDEVGWTINAFVVVTLGGVGSPAGALLGGLLLGLINTLTAQYIGPAFTTAMMFLVLVLMLLIRPHGILGQAYGDAR
jgi:branched-chain amino acid transport system permease protein